MRRYLVNRSVQSLVVLFLFLSVMFFLTQLLMSGDFAIIVGFGSGRDAVAELRQQLGLDLPLWQRYFIWAGRLLRGDLGDAFLGPPVGGLVRDALMVSAITFGLGTVIAFQIGSWLGKAITWQRRGVIVSLMLFIGIMFYTTFPPTLAWLGFEFDKTYRFFRSLPTSDLWQAHQGELWGTPTSFILAMLLLLGAVALLLSGINQLLKQRFRGKLPGVICIILLAGVWFWGWSQAGASDRVIDVLKFTGLTLILYILMAFGETMLLMRTSMIDTLHEEYIFTARAKGLPERTIRDKHAARNALLPVLSRVAVNLPYLMAGLVMLESATKIHGIGSLLFQSIDMQNVPVVMGALLAIGVVALVVGLLLDIALAWLDPRIRFGQAASRPRSAVAELRRGNSHRLADLLTGLNPVHWVKQIADALHLLPRRLKLGWQQFRKSWRVFAQNRLALLGVLLLMIFLVMTFIHPLLIDTVWPANVYDPLVGFDMMLIHPAPPSSEHLLGTDTLGRDILSMLLASTPSTMAAALTAAIGAAVVGTLMGALSAYYQGSLLDTVFSYISNTLLIVPVPIVMVIVGVRFFQELAAFKFGLFYGLLTGASIVATVMRTQALQLMAKPFIEASWVAGASGWRIITVHLIPHMLPLAAVQMMLTVAGAVITYGFVAFVGATEFRLNWGAMVHMAFTFSGVLHTEIPWYQVLSPALALSLLAAAFYFVSRGLHEVAEPRLRRR